MSQLEKEQEVIQEDIEEDIQEVIQEYEKCRERLKVIKEKLVISLQEKLGFKIENIGEYFQKGDYRLRLVEGNKEKIEVFMYKKDNEIKCVYYSTYLGEYPYSRIEMLYQPDTFSQIEKICEIRSLLQERNHY